MNPLLLAICVATLAMFSAPFSQAGNTGNATLASPEGNASVDTSSTMRYSRDDMCTYIENNIDQPLGTEIRNATGPNGHIKVYEAFIPWVGAADSGTIGIPTWREPLWACALILMHEYEHAERAHTATPDNPDSQDPATAPPCGDVTHVEMGGRDWRRLAHLSCEGPPAMPPEAKEACCDKLEEWRHKMEEVLNEVQSAGTACPWGLPIDAYCSATPCCP